MCIKIQCKVTKYTIYQFNLIFRCHNLLSQNNWKKKNQFFFAGVCISLSEKQQQKISSQNYKICRTMLNLDTRQQIPSDPTFYQNVTKYKNRSKHLIPKILIIYNPKQVNINIKLIYTPLLVSTISVPVKYKNQIQQVSQRYIINKFKKADPDTLKNFWLIASQTFIIPAKLFYLRS
eukprot:TRINITY_DN108_c0_g1_i2.p1 TRINITY_DN108_c0_g1~~TRINITY_DN108_c0_g1_i2.p1  ORF type:complete len:204 (+),score=-16.24 TRINITY_DN108_c0_g1_i2:84-614(+)